MTAVLTRPAPPTAPRIALARVGLEVRLFARQKQQVVLSFAYPVVMMVIFGSVLGGDMRPGQIPFPKYLHARRRCWRPSPPPGWCRGCGRRRWMRRGRGSSRCSWGWPAG
jgi:hypothetical protein